MVAFGKRRLIRFGAYRGTGADRPARAQVETIASASISTS